MKAALFYILLVLGNISCSGTLGDYSTNKIQYQVIALSGIPTPPRRLLIDIQFKAMNDSIAISNAIPNAAQQNTVIYNFIDAIRGADLNVDQLIKDGYYTGGLSAPELGLFKTTTDKVLPEAMKLADNEIVVTFEDDVIFRADLDFSFRQALRQVPDDWDMLFLGCYEGSLTKNGGLTSPFTPTNISIANGINYRICPEETLTQISGTPWRVMTNGCTSGGYAYAMRGSSARKINDLLNTSKPYSMPIDLTYQQFYGAKIRAYCLEHELVSINYALPSTLR